MDEPTLEESQLPWKPTLPVFMQGPGKRYILLSLSLLLVILLYPYFLGSKIDTAIFTFLISIVLIAATYAIANSRRYAIAAILLIVPSLLLQWTYFFYETRDLLLASRLASLFVMVFVLLVLLRDVIRAKTPVPKNIIWGAIAVYLLLGMTWSTFYSIIEILTPGSFAYTLNPEMILGASDFLYFSFVTIATLGYGDIVPMTAQARSFAILEAITGALYLAILISKLVGMASSEQRK
jgi:hypothetical protein